MKLYTFYQLFQIQDAETIVALRRIGVGMVTLNIGAIWQRGVIFSGIDIFNFTNSLFDCKEVGDKLVIRRIYPQLTAP